MKTRARVPHCAIARAAGRMRNIHSNPPGVSADKHSQKKLFCRLLTRLRAQNVCVSVKHF
jgi:hypothetical protein